MCDVAIIITSFTDLFHWQTWRWSSQCAGLSLILKLWHEKDVDTKLTHRQWRDVGSHSSLWSSVKFCCHKRNLEEMPHLLSCARYHFMIHFTLRTSYYVQIFLVRLQHWNTCNQVCDGKKNHDYDQDIKWIAWSGDRQKHKTQCQLCKYLAWPLIPLSLVYVH